MMKKKLLLVLAIGLLPTIVLADDPDQCALDSTCSFSIRGKFNNAFITPQLKAGQSYKCSVVRGPGGLLSIKSITASKGVSYDLKGGRFDKSFIIHGPSTGVGDIRYTIYSHNDPWHKDDIQFKCEQIED